MSLLINNDLIWVSIPKCASISIETALLNSNLNITKFSEYEEKIVMSLKNSKEVNHMNCKLHRNKPFKVRIKAKKCRRLINKCCKSWVKKR